MKHIDLVIITNHNINHNILKTLSYQYFKYAVMDNPFQFKDISFDYLIFDNLETVKNIDIMIDNDVIITNNVFQTNYEHIYAIGKINKSQLSFEEQLLIIINNIKNNN